MIDRDPVPWDHAPGLEGRHNSTNSTALKCASCIEWRIFCSWRADAGGM